jgi:toxin-antitoxin system PIN domain toxin
VFVIDTNLLLYAVNPDAPEHARARQLLGEWRAGERPWFVTWGIIYEFLRLSTHPRVFPAPITLQQARAWTSALLAGRADSILVATDRHAAVLDELVASHPAVRGNPVHDLHIAALMMEHGVPEIRTADTDFHQFGFLRVVNPLLEGGS